MNKNLNYSQQQHGFDVSRLTESRELEEDDEDRRLRELALRIPTIFTKKIEAAANETEERQQIPSYIANFINLQIDKLLKQRLESYKIFENKDIYAKKESTMNAIRELQQITDNSVKKTGDIISGHLHILKIPESKMDAVNKEYVDWLYLTISEKLETKISKNSDLDLTHFRIKNLQTPKDLNDAANKNYVDYKFDALNNVKTQSIQHIFSKGQTITNKKTFFFNPGFVCPQKIYVVSIGFSTSPYKYKIGEKVKLGEINPTKLYFMVNNEIKSEFPIEKDVQLGYILKDFKEPLIFEKGDNIMMVIETAIEDTAVNIMFY